MTLWERREKEIVKGPKISTVNLGVVMSRGLYIISKKLNIRSLTKKDFICHFMIYSVVLLFGFITLTFIKNKKKNEKKLVRLLFSLLWKFLSKLQP